MNLETYVSIVIDQVKELGFGSLLPSFSDYGDGICIYLPTDKNPHYIGMQMNYYIESNIYEVSEYMAGKNEDELHIFTKTKSLKIALKSLYKGNKKRKIIEKW